MADHSGKALVHVALFTTTDFIDRGLHIVIQATFRDATEDFAGMVMCIEQNLMRLGEISPQEEGATVTQLELGDLQLGVHTTDERIVFAPVELEGFTGCKG